MPDPSRSEESIRGSPGPLRPISLMDTESVMSEFDGEKRRREVNENQSSPSQSFSKKPARPGLKSRK